jgi:MoaA/NifB/PqqE/SkfB family radical SAM enzyme
MPKNTEFGGGEPLIRVGILKTGCVVVEFFASTRSNPDLTPDPFPKKEGEYAHKSSYFENTYP